MRIALDVADWRDDLCPRLSIIVGPVRVGTHVAKRVRIESRERSAFAKVPGID